MYGRLLSPGDYNSNPTAEPKSTCSLRLTPSRRASISERQREASVEPSSSLSSSSLSSSSLSSSLSSSSLSSSSSSSSLKRVKIPIKVQRLRHLPQRDERLAHFNGELPSKRQRLANDIERKKPKMARLQQDPSSADLSANQEPIVMSPVRNKIRKAFNDVVDERRRLYEIDFCREYQRAVLTSLAASVGTARTSWRASFVSKMTGQEKASAIDPKAACSVGGGDEDEANALCHWQRLNVSVCDHSAETSIGLRSFAPVTFNWNRPQHELFTQKEELQHRLLTSTHSLLGEFSSDDSSDSESENDETGGNDVTSKPAAKLSSPDKFLPVKQTDSVLKVRLFAEADHQVNGTSAVGIGSSKPSSRSPPSSSKSEVPSRNISLSSVKRPPELECPDKFAKKIGVLYQRYESQRVDLFSELLQSLRSNSDKFFTTLFQELDDFIAVFCDKAPPEARFNWDQSELVVPSLLSRISSAVPSLGGEKQLLARWVCLVNLTELHSTNRRGYDELVTPDLDNPSNINGKELNAEDALSSFRVFFCPIDGLYDCLEHESQLKPTHSPQRPLHKFLLTSSQPCNDTSCYKLFNGVKLADGSTSSPTQKATRRLSVLVTEPEQGWTPAERTLFNVLATSTHDYCRIAKVMLTKTCHQVHAYAELKRNNNELHSPQNSSGQKSSSQSGPHSRSGSSRGFASVGQQQLARASMRHNYMMKAGGNGGAGKRHVHKFTPCSCRETNPTALSCHKLAQNCSCVDRSHNCSKYCDCFRDCINRFQGCKCGKDSEGTCGTAKCPCFKDMRECDPELCGSCGAGDDDLVPACRNVQIQRRMRKLVRVGASDVAGMGAFLIGDAQPGDLIYEYSGEVVDTEVADWRGTGDYDKFELCSYLFDLNVSCAVDAQFFGNKIRYANHSLRPNCRARIALVDGEHRIGIFATRPIEPGEELFFNYGYGDKHKDSFASIERVTTLDVEAAEYKAKRASRRRNMEKKPNNQAEDEMEPKPTEADNQANSVSTSTKKPARKRHKHRTHPTASVSQVKWGRRAHRLGTH